MLNVNNTETITLNKDDIIELYYQFLKTCKFIIQIIILFLSITKIIKVLLLSFIISVMLQVIRHNDFQYIHSDMKDMLWYLLVYDDYDYFDIALIIIVISVLFIIIMRIKMISNKIDKKLEELKTTIKQKEIIIERLNKKLHSKTN
jgi:hypothetical protein